jgi:Domain of unknown function (DUF4296)
MKRQIASLTILILTGLFSCETEEKEPPPKNLIPIPRMVAFLNDIHDTESTLLLSGIRQDTTNALYPLLEKKIFEKHHLDSARVMTSLKYYTENIELLDSIYSLLKTYKDTTRMKKP